MNFVILDYKKKRTCYTYLIKGEQPWDIANLTAHFRRVSQEMGNFVFVYDFDSPTPFCLVDQRAPNKRRASLESRGTLDKRVKRISVFDFGLGKDIIERFMNSVELEP